MAGPPNDSFVALARNNALANTRLHAACERLSEAELRATRTAFFPSLLVTLNHIRLVDLFYIDGLEGGSAGHAVFADHDQPPPFADLAASQRALDRRLLAFCEALGLDAVGGIVRLHRPDRIQEETAQAVLLHLFQHQVHHRGQVHAMLAGTDVPPPQLDEFLLAEDASLRRPEMAALGFVEPVL